ncbi:hypothetical protein LJC24_03370 [Desulfococcaceae bacterium OttesenSCG-928-F15]|nr:hypothetical protein [Desulfococcaceae bacterium OttesenSCG-928-F15]
MDQKSFVKSLIAYNKTAFEQVLSASGMAQAQMEKVVEMMLLQGNVPEEGKKMVRDWLDNMQKGRKDIQETMDNSFRQLETYLLSLIP